MNILEEALPITQVERQRDYGSPEANFAHIAGIASAILKREVTSREVVVIMLATKLSREMHKHKRDNLVDLAGYAWVLSRIEGDE